MDSKIKVEDFNALSGAFTNPKTIPAICEIANRFNKFEMVTNPVTADVKDLSLFISFVMSILVANSDCSDFKDEEIIAKHISMIPLWDKNIVTFENKAVETAFLIGCAYPYTGYSECWDAMVKYYSGENAVRSNRMSVEDASSRLVNITCEVCAELSGRKENTQTTSLFS